MSRHIKRVSAHAEKQRLAQTSIAFGANLPSAESGSEVTMSSAYELRQFGLDAIQDALIPENH